LRVGMGYDVHRLVEGRDLILGGVRVEHNKGLDGHSDADVLVHAIMDALLGAVGQGDIGKHFPDTDPAYKGISSMRLLNHVKGIILEAGFQVGNIDATLVAQRPKLAPYIPEMVTRIADELGVKHSQVNVKATTTEGLGFTGTGDGIAAYAITCVMQN
jgi:2-C-methyl-D-erythritol 2,4-cyclodiphosphate synthase